MAQTNEVAARNAIARGLKPSLVAKLYHYAATQLLEAEGRVRMILYVCPSIVQGEKDHGVCHNRAWVSVAARKSEPRGPDTCLGDRAQLADAPRAEQQYFSAYLQPLLLIKAQLDVAAAHRFHALDLDEKEYVCVRVEKGHAYRLMRGRAHTRAHGAAVGHVYFACEQTQRAAELQKTSTVLVDAPPRAAVRPHVPVCMCGGFARCIECHDWRRIGAA
jgi:hypothetical protein